MKITKKTVHSKRSLLLRGMTVLMTLIFILSTFGLASQKAEADYIRIFSESGRLPATPAEVVGNKVDFRDAFRFTGEFASDVLGGDPYAANHSYLSQERSNVVMIYDGVNSDQKSKVWYTQQLSLNQDFEFESYVFLSNANATLSDLGVPDGMAFVMQNDPKFGDAIGGTGGGLGVYLKDKDPKNVNMIYNAVTVEFDTFSNSGSNDGTNYDRELITKGYPVSWPHVAIGSTKASQFYGYNKTTMNLAFDEFTHLIPTVPSTRAEGNQWFGAWKKITVKWHPLEDGIYGNLSYQFADYPEQTVKLNIDEYFNYTSRSNWDRKVTWGFTGSNGKAGNAFAVMITKLPQEPEIEVNRKVRNVTKGETEFKTSTIANVGDQLEYQVDVKNTVLEDIDIPLKKVDIRENLQSNQYVAGSFDFNNSKVTGSVAQPAAKVDANNNFTFEDTTYEYKPGESFSYTYSVKVGNDTTEFINDVAISSTYTTERNYGETTVNILPENLQIVKTVDSQPQTNPTVNDTVTVKLEASIKSGRFLTEQIKDSVPADFEVVPGTTKYYESGVVGPIQVMDDTSIWSGNNLTIPGLSKVINGGTATNNKLIVEYQIKPKNPDAKGKTYTTDAAEFIGTNQYVEDAEINDFQAVSNTADIQVKTDLVISFKNTLDDSLLNAADIISANADFNGKNPVTLYYNKDDSYDLSSIIAEISQKIETNQQMTLYKVEGDAVSKTDISGVIRESGNTIDVYYTSEALITVEFVDETGTILPGYTVTINSQIGSQVNLTLEEEVTKQINQLLEAGYEMLQRPANEQNVSVNSPNITVQYKVGGLVFIKSAPAEIDFGEIKYDAKVTRVDNPSTNNQLVISDTRADKSSGWTLYARVNTPMTSTSSSAVMIDGLRYVSSGEEKTLNAGNQAVYTKASGGELDVTSTWGTSADTDGLKLVMDPSLYKVEKGTYVGVINWEIMAGTP